MINSLTRFNNSSECDFLKKVKKYNTVTFYLKTKTSMLIQDILKKYKSVDTTLKSYSKQKTDNVKKAKCNKREDENIKKFNLYEMVNSLSIKKSAKETKTNKSSIYDYVRKLVKNKCKNDDIKYEHLDIKKSILFCSCNFKKKNTEKIYLRDITNIFHSLFVKDIEINTKEKCIQFDKEKLYDLIIKIQRINTEIDLSVELNENYKLLDQFFNKHEKKVINTANIQNYTAALVFCTFLFEILHIFYIQQEKMKNDKDLLKLYQSLVYNLFFEILHIFNQFFMYNNQEHFIESICYNKNKIVDDTSYCNYKIDRIVLDDIMIYKKHTVNNLTFFIKLLTLRPKDKIDIDIESCEEKNKYIKEFLYMICYDSLKKYDGKNKDLQLCIKHFKNQFKMYHCKLKSKKNEKIKKSKRKFLIYFNILILCTAYITKLYVKICYVFVVFNRKLYRVITV